MSNPSVSSSNADQSFAMPQFQIVANPQSNDTYSLQMVNDSDAKPNQSNLNNNNLTPINYDTSFLDDFNHDAEFNANTIKEEFTTMHEQLAQQDPIDEDYDDNFEIDDFFRIKPKPLQQQTASIQQNEEIKVETAGYKEPDGEEATSENAPVANASETSDANDIIQQAAIIDDDFFSQIRESMDVLYDKILC